MKLLPTCFLYIPDFDGDDNNSNKRDVIWRISAYLINDN